MNKIIFFSLILIFIISLILRFLYFPNNIYFGFDQARDAFAAQDILNGNLKIIGPPTSFEGLRHGVLYYYLYAPFYLIGNGDPAVVAAFLRVVNALGVFLIFLVGKMLFNKYVGIISSWLFTVSFEQTQFALYLNHPSFAVISILIMYLGLGILIFRKKSYGFIIALLGLGLSIQFEFILTYLSIPLLLTLFIFRGLIPRLNIKIMALGISVFLLTIITYAIAEIRFSFRSFNFLLQLFNQSEKSLTRIISTYLFEMIQVIKFNIVGSDRFKALGGLLLLCFFVLTLFSQVRKQLVFLSIWFFSAIAIYFVSGGADLKVDIIQYHPNVGLSPALMIFVGYLLYLIGKKTHFLVTLSIIALITLTNILMVQKVNPYGSMPEINAQSFMLLSNEKEVLDYIYQDAGEGPFAVKGITMPYIINTTWSYLFEWYGKQKYGYLPVWNGKNALGYPGKIIVEEAQDKAPLKRYLIIEPIRGIPQHLIEDYLEEESYFTDLYEERKIGKFIVQKRKIK